MKIENKLLHFLVSMIKIDQISAYGSIPTVICFKRKQIIKLANKANPLKTYRNYNSTVTNVPHFLWSHLQHTT